MQIQIVTDWLSYLFLTVFCHSFLQVNQAMKGEVKEEGKLDMKEGHINDSTTSTSSTKWMKMA